ncbi:MAG: hypothetical protein HOV80_11195 [Polyangiaceae bacterium]|nr:hypothetical protein [Polyangiaceae bacterium]
MDPVEDIIRAIEEAFAGVPCGEITIHEAEVIDAYGTEAMRRKARARDTETDWRDVPDSSVTECSDALTFLDPVGWRFYLPVYMRFGLRHLRSGHNNAIDHAIYSLNKGDVADLANYKLQRFRMLDRAQTHAVQRFLAFAADNDAFCDSVIAKSALASHWSRAAEFA